jgi:hypothetical protein
MAHFQHYGLRPLACLQLLADVTRLEMQNCITLPKPLDGTPGLRDVYMTNQMMAACDERLDCVLAA